MYVLDRQETRALSERSTYQTVRPYTGVNRVEVGVKIERNEYDLEEMW